jgi:hypothetical protein
MEWLVENKEWFFSGFGVFVLTLVITLFVKNRGKKVGKMKQKSGSNSTNIQIGGDYKS